MVCSQLEGPQLRRDTEKNAGCSPIYTKNLISWQFPDLDVSMLISAQNNKGNHKRAQKSSSLSSKNRLDHRTNFDEEIHQTRRSDQIDCIPIPSGVLLIITAYEDKE